MKDACLLFCLERVLTHNYLFCICNNLILLAEEQEKEWARIDDNIRHNRAPQTNTSVQEEAMSAWRRRDWYQLICMRLWSSRASIKARDETVFRVLRREFILDRELDEPFAPKDPAKRVKDSFNFGRYLGLAQIHILSHAVEVQKKTWSFFGLMAIAFYGVAVVVHEKVMVSFVQRASRHSCNLCAKHCQSDALRLLPCRLSDGFGLAVAGWCSWVTSF